MKEEIDIKAIEEFESKGSIKDSAEENVLHKEILMQVVGDVILEYRKRGSITTDAKGNPLRD